MTARVSAVVLVIAAVAGCGGEERESQPRRAAAVDLVISVTSPQGRRETALACAASARNRRCDAARRLADFLARQPPRGRVCTQIYGGPEKAHVRGTIGDRRIDRRFSKSNGCEIADWEHAEALLAAS